MLLQVLFNLPKYLIDVNHSICSLIQQKKRQKTTTKKRELFHNYLSTRDVEGHDHT